MPRQASSSNPSTAAAAAENDSEASNDEDDFEEDGEDEEEVLDDDDDGQSHHERIASKKVKEIVDSKGTGQRASTVKRYRTICELKWMQVRWKKNTKSPYYLILIILSFW